jgi:hypothetical protein
LLRVCKPNPSSPGTSANEICIAEGVLTNAHLPDVVGLGSFQGHMFHTVSASMRELNKLRTNRFLRRLGGTINTPADLRTSQSFTTSRARRLLLLVQAQRLYNLSRIWRTLQTSYWSFKGHRRQLMYETIGKPIRIRSRMKLHHSQDGGGNAIRILLVTLSVPTLYRTWTWFPMVGLKLGRWLRSLVSRRASRWTP